MDSLLQSRKYGAIKKTDTEKNGFYVIMFSLEVYKLQDITTIDRQSITAG